MIWIGIEDTKSIEPVSNYINEELVDLGFKKDNRSFSPHITVGRVRTAKNKQELISVIQQFQKIEFGKQKISSIKLMKSVLTPKGPIYSVVKEITL